jgi:thiol-disulfide isomerase/thioredoxin
MPRAATALIGRMTPGLVALIVALVVALAGGAVWRRTNGRMRTVAGEARRPAEDQARARVTGSSSPEAAPAAGAVLTDLADRTSFVSAEQLGHELGERATLVQFSSAFCAPCRATRRILADVAGLTQGVAHVEIDAESRLDLVRQLNVLRTPTVLVLAADGRIVRRASGQPRKPDVIAAIGVAAGV